MVGLVVGAQYLSSIPARRQLVASTVDGRGQKVAMRIGLLGSAAVGGVYFALLALFAAYGLGAPAGRWVAAHYSFARHCRGHDADSAGAAGPGHADGGRGAQPPEAAAVLQAGGVGAHAACWARFCVPGRSGGGDRSGCVGGGDGTANLIATQNPYLT